MGLVEFAGWLATQVFDVVGSVAGAAAEPADGGSGDVDLQVGKTVFHDVPAKVSGQGRSLEMQGLRHGQQVSVQGPLVRLNPGACRPPAPPPLPADAHRALAEPAAAQGRQGRHTLLRPAVRGAQQAAAVCWTSQHTGSITLPPPALPTASRCPCPPHLVAACCPADAGP